MAKSRFPGKALKLNLRKRIRFRDDFEPSPEDIRATQIINGLKLFRNVFGDSDEDYDFEGFTIHNEGERTSIAKYQCIKALNTNSSLEEERLARNSNVSPSIENGSFINLNEPGDCPEGSKGFLNGPPKLSLIDQLKLERRTNMLHKLHQNRNLSKVQLKKLTLKNNAIIAKRAQLIRQRKLLSGKGKMKRKFILPSISVRSSRIIKPNKRLFSDITAICSTTGQEDVNKAISESDKKVLRPKKEIEPLSDETTEKDEVCRSINLYTDSLTERGRGQVGRPPKRITRRIDNTNEDAVGIDDQLSPHKHPKEDRVKEKIEKLLRSPWHNRLKHSKKDKEEEGPSLVPSGAASKTILRKARLNLNKKTLQKIRSPSSVRRLIPPLEEDSTDTKCTICKNGESVIRRYGAPCCVTCDTIIAEFIEGSSESLSCIGRQGECQLVGLSADERCLACWLARMLLHCTVPSLLHDRLRKQLPSVLKDRVPTSLGLSNSIHLLTTASEMELPDHSKRSLSTETSSNIFGSVIDLPGGWKRKIGNELTVISPSGEKFKTISKLEDYLNRQGVQADPRILFGYSSIKPFQNKDSSAFINFKPKLNDKMHVVFTTLPGGWTRRIKLRNAGVRVDTYVCSPDGRTFRSRKELSAYFSQIGKVDDIYKYFPVRSRSTDPSSANSTDNAETSTTEPCSSSDFCSEGSAEENTPGINSDADTDNRLMQTNSKQDSDSGNSCELLEDDDDSQSTHSELENRPNKNVSTSKFVRPAPKSRKFNGEHDIPISDNEIDLNDDDSGGHINLSFFNQSDDENSEHVAPSVNKNNHEVGQVDLSHFQTSVGNVEPKDTSIFSHQNSSFNKLDSTGEENVHKRLCSDKSLRNKKAEETELNTSSQIPMPENKNNIEGKKEAVNSFAPIDDESTKYIRVSFRDFLARSLPKPDKDKSDKTSSKKNKKKKKKKKMKKTKSEKVVDKVSKNDKINSNDKLKCVPPLDLNTLVDTKNEVPNDIPRPVSICEEAAPPLPNKMAANIEAMSEEEALPVSPSEGSSVVKQQKKISLKKKVLVPSKKKKLKRPIVEKKKLAKKAKKVKKPSAFTTERFGGDWSRKIRWGENGNGKVSFLTSPDGQKIVSKIELLAYFKKAGKSVFNMEHYFPDNLIRSQIENTSKKSQEENASKEHDASQKEVDKSPKAPNSSKMEGKKKIGLRVHLPMKRTSNLLTKLKKRKMKFDRLHNKDCDNTTIGNSGPRVKHVCRSQAQVLGMARAVFPDQMTDKMDMSKKKKWCNKCPGCTTPNCKKCISCMNMKKFGGPGTFKKPCVKRKCLNPKYCSDTVKKYIPRKMKSQASGNSLEVLAPEILNCGPHLREENNAVAETVNKGREVPNKDSVTHKEISTDDDETCLDKAEGSDIGRDSFDEEETNITELEKSVFVPRQMPKTSDNKDQRADIQMGKEITPGATVNIDYWQGYDAEEMLLYGFPIITSGVSNHRSYCFRCGSKGKEELFYCAYCCEGVHPFCLEEGEGPESETEEEFWICRRCIMCHICGSPGHDNLLQCSSCRMYYHLECLGPSSHSSCQSSIGQPWLCVACTKCSSCCSPNVSEWIDVSEKIQNSDGLEVISKPFCNRCIELRESQNFCPLCSECYEDDDFDSKMMECGRCNEWIHASCEGISDEYYQILSFLPDSVEYVCKMCLKDQSAVWLEAVMKEMLFGMKSVLEALLSSKCARHLHKIQLQPARKNYLSPKTTADQIQFVPELQQVAAPILEPPFTAEELPIAPSEKGNPEPAETVPIVKELARKSEAISAMELLDETEMKMCTRPVTRSLAAKPTPPNCDKIKNCTVRLLDICKPKAHGEIDSTDIPESPIGNVHDQDEHTLHETPHAFSSLTEDQTNLQSSPTGTENSSILITPRMKISKDIDDDCISSEASSFCGSDTEIESIIDEAEDPRDLHDINEKVNGSNYKSILQFHVDVIRVLESGRSVNRSQSRSCKLAYIKLLKDYLPWFDVKLFNIFSLVNENNPFPIPFDDHMYLSSKLMSGRSCSSLSWTRNVQKDCFSPAKSADDERKCALCSINGDDDPNMSGRLLYLGQDEWLHINCGIWSSEVFEEQDGGLENVYFAVSRGKQIKCTFCQERGATVGCCHRSCQVAYHFLCARKLGCFFMEDKRIFCSQHADSAEGDRKTEDFTVSRCVFVNMDSEKKRWKQVLSSRVNVAVGSLTIENLGKISSNLDCPEALIPVDFICSRIYWSTANPMKKVKYTCRSKCVYPSDICNEPTDLTFNKTIDHSLDEATVQREMTVVKQWLKRIEDQQQARQTLETNIIPPHMCPLYKNILKEQQQRARRDCIENKKVYSDIKSCVDDIVDKVNCSVEEESLLLDTELRSIVSPDDNEIISMVLKDLPTCDSSMYQSTPCTSSRQSPFDLDFLAACDQAVDVENILSQDQSQVVLSDIVDSACYLQGQNMDANAMYERLFGACDAQIQDQAAGVQNTSLNRYFGVDLLGIKPDEIHRPLEDNSTNEFHSQCHNNIYENESDLNILLPYTKSMTDSTLNETPRTDCNFGSIKDYKPIDILNIKDTIDEEPGDIYPNLPSLPAPSGNATEEVTQGSGIHNEVVPVKHDSENSSSEMMNLASESKKISPFLTEPLCPAATTSISSASKSGTSKGSSKKQVCRVLPMLSSNSSRRSSSASDQSDNVNQAPDQESNRTLSRPNTVEESVNEEDRKTESGTKTKDKICMKRNYRTVIKKYPLRSGFRKNKPYETVQIEINETIEMPGQNKKVCKRVKKKWRGVLDSEDDRSPLKAQEEQNEEDECSNVSGRSHKVLKFSDDRNNITVSIVNNDGLCNFPKKRRHRYRHKTVVQLDGAADSSSEMSEESSTRASSAHSELALRIKEQSLARSSPGDEGPYKCSKCKRLYRTKDSYHRHIQSCNFEVDSSSTSEDDDKGFLNTIALSAPEFKGNNPHLSAVDKVMAQNVSSRNGEPSSSKGESHMEVEPPDTVLGSTLDSSHSSLDKLKEMCAPPFLEDNKRGKVEARTPGVHRQVRNSIRRMNQGPQEKPQSKDLVHNISGTEVFIPPSVSPLKMPVNKKHASPRRYTNVRLLKGSQGYQYRRAPPQVLTIPKIQPKLSSNANQQQQGLPVAIQSFGVQPHTYSSLHSQYQPQAQIAATGQFTTAVDSPQVVTVVSGPSVAVPQGYSLQYVGSYRGGDVCQSPSLLSYPAAPVVVPSPLVVAPQPSPVVVPQVMNVNIPYTITAPETLVLNQPTVVPNVQYITQPQHNLTNAAQFQHPQTFHQPMVQHHGYQQMPTVMQFNQGVQLQQPQTSIAHASGTSTIVAGNILENALSDTSTQRINVPVEPSTSEAVPCETTISLPNSDIFKPKPQASVAPQFLQSPPKLTAEVAPTILSPSTPRPVLYKSMTARSVATVAPAMFTLTSPTMSSSVSSTLKISPDYVPVEAIKPRPTYSYRDAMKDILTERKKHSQKTGKSDQLKGSESAGQITTANLKELSKNKMVMETDQDEKAQTKREEQSFKLVLRKDHSSSKFNLLPLSRDLITLPSPEVKELRIKAKVSVGPKRKKCRPSEQNRELIIANRDITNDLLVNEQLPNISSALNQNALSDDPTLFEKPKTSTDPYIVFELISEDGYKVESKYISEVWQKVFDAVTEARENLKIGKDLSSNRHSNKQNMSGLHMLGLTHNAVQYLLEQLPGSKDCHRYSFQFHRRPKEEEIIIENPSGCARSEAFKTRSPYDVFSWLASKHRRLPERSPILYDEIQLSTRRATSLELPMAMRYRHLCENAREAVGVFRSNIHGRGLFCKRDIDSGEMVIEYSGQVIRSSLCDMREKSYESRGIGCYMFRIDEETVIDATMHGNAARFINHSCDPNCYSRVVDILGKKHIIIFALRRILRGEELTYDYKFPIEEDKIPCSCGARRCRKYLN